MNTAIARRATLLAVVIGLLVSCVASAAGGARLEVIESARVGQWIKVGLRLVADQAGTVEFAPKEVFLEFADGSRTSNWRWEAFFPEASANLKKGDRITSEGTKVDGKILSLSFVQLAENSAATIEVPLAPGNPQEAVLYFEARPGAKASRLSFGKLPPVKLK